MIRFNILLTLTSLFLVTDCFADNFITTNVPSKYGPPYYNDDIHLKKPLPSDTVNGAIDLWWPQYQAYWHVSNCTYQLNMLDDGETTGLFAYLPLGNGCTGALGIHGTPYCENDSAVLDGERCIITVDEEKNLGGICN